MFYSVIAYYALALLAMPGILWVLSWGRNRLATILIVGFVCMVIHQVLFTSLAHLRPVAILELFKLLLTAKYGFFQMTGYVMIGAAVGWILRQNYSRPDFRSLVVKYAVLSTGLGVLMLFVQPPENVARSFNLPGAPQLLIYLGVLLGLIACFVHLNRAGGQATGILGRMNGLLILSGILALPIFVGHEIVIPLKDILELTGLPGPLPLAFALGLFMAGLGFAYWRLFRLVAR